MQISALSDGYEQGQRSFVEALNSYVKPTIKQQPFHKGEYLSVNIDDAVRQQGVRELESP